MRKLVAATGPQSAVIGLAIIPRSGMATFARVVGPVRDVDQWLKSGSTPWDTAKGVQATSHAFNLGSWLDCSALVAPVVHAFQFARIAKTR